MKVQNFTKAQKTALLESLMNQTSPMTNGEKQMLEALKNDAIEIIETEEGFEMQKLGNKVRQNGMDTFGEDYRNRWITLKESSNGVFFTSAYFGNKRIYLKNIYSL